MAEAATTAETEFGAKIGGTSSEASSSATRKAKSRTATIPVIQSDDTTVGDTDGRSVRKTTLAEALGYLHYIDTTVEAASGHDWALRSLVIKGNVSRCCAYIRAHLTTGEAPEFE
jgi:hypothetical protein